MTQNCWSACFLVATWTLGCDQVVSLITSIPVATSNVCRDLFFFLIQSQPHFSVSIVSIQFPISGRDLTLLPFDEIYVATSILCHNIIVCCLLHFCVATSIRCRDIISVVSHSFLVTAPLFMLRLKIVCLFILLSRHGI